MCQLTCKSPAPRRKLHQIALKRLFLIQPTGEDAQTLSDRHMAMGRGSGWPWTCPVHERRMCISVGIFVDACRLHAGDHRAGACLRLQRRRRALAGCSGYFCCVQGSPTGPARGAKLGGGQPGGHRCRALSFVWPAKEPREGTQHQPSQSCQTPAGLTPSRRPCWHCAYAHAMHGDDLPPDDLSREGLPKLIHITVRAKTWGFPNYLAIF